MNPNTVAIVSPTSNVTETTGAYCESALRLARLLTSVARANMKVAMNRPRVNLVRRDRMKRRTARGEYWLAASCIATSVVANTTATNANVAAATVPATFAAVDGSLIRNRR